MPAYLEEISTEIGTSGTVTALRHLEALERKGVIVREAGSSRGIRLKGDPLQELAQLPIVGVVNAGQPVLAFENIEGYYPFEEVKAGGGRLFLRVRGDSMIEDAIVVSDVIHSYIKHEWRNHRGARNRDFLTISCRDGSPLSASGYNAGGCRSSVSS